MQNEDCPIVSVSAILPAPARDKSPLQSKKFWALLVGIGTSLLVTQFGLDPEMTGQALDAIVWLVGSLVVGQAGHDMAKSLRT